MKRLILAATMAATLAVLAACSDSNPTGPGNAAVTGTYALRTINGSAVPWTEPGSTAQESFTINSGSLVVNSNGTYTLTYAVVFREGGQSVTTSFSMPGTWTQSNRTLTLRDNEGDSMTASWDGDRTMTIAEADGVLVFRK
jgi:hypothetical protein